MKVILADDHAIVRQGIRMVLEQAGNFSIVAEIQTVNEIEPSVREHQPDLLILDYKMPGGDTYATAEVLKRENPSLKILVFTGIQSAAAIQRLANSKIDALLLKDDSPKELLKAIKAIKADTRYISSLVEPYLKEISIQLTGRELQLLNLIVMGWARKDIAEHLGITVETIKTYRKNLMSKLDVHTVTELIIKAQDLKLLDQ